MTVTDIFAFHGGRTVFAVLVHDPGVRIKPGRYGVVTKGKQLMTLQIEGEMLPSSRPNPNMRAVSTTDSVDADKLKRYPELALVYEPATVAVD
jgi:hypothetical protein